MLSANQIAPFSVVSVKNKYPKILEHVTIGTT
jgi:hypothetical protein